MPFSVLTTVAVIATTAVVLAPALIDATTVTGDLLRHQRTARDLVEAQSRNGEVLMVTEFVAWPRRQGHGELCCARSSHACRQT